MGTHSKGLWKESSWSWMSCSSCRTHERGKARDQWGTEPPIPPQKKNKIPTKTLKNTPESQEGLGMDEGVGFSRNLPGPCHCATAESSVKILTLPHLVSYLQKGEEEIWNSFLQNTYLLMWFPWTIQDSGPVKQSPELSSEAKAAHKILILSLHKVCTFHWSLGGLEAPEHTWVRGSHLSTAQSPEPLFQLLLLVRM